MYKPVAESNRREGFVPSESGAAESQEILQSQVGDPQSARLASKDKAPLNQLASRIDLITSTPSWARFEAIRLFTEQHPEIRAYIQAELKI